jgi:PEP-CTERM motif
MRRLTKLFLAVALVMSVAGLAAGVINFNTASDNGTSGQPFGSASDAGTTVDFWVGLNSLTCPGSCNPGVELTTAYGAEPGDPTTAFDTSDQRAGGDSPFLTDEPNGPDLDLDYFLVFSGVNILNLTLDVLDYGGDGGAEAGNFATLQVFSTPDWDPANLLPGGSVSGPPIGAFIDGLVTPLSFFGAGGLPIRSARVTFSAPDIGTGIDDVRWTAVPEPATVVLFGSGLLALVAFARKRRTGA